MKFKDEVTIRIRSGNGGPGCASFRREKYVPRGGPDGGDGGKGGDVIFRVNDRLNTLIDIRPNKLYSARNGAPGEGQNKSGPDGADLVMEVPRGTVIFTGQDKLADLGEIDEATILKGGRGGKGNTFYKSSINQTPTQFQKGEAGEELEIKVELKLIADIGLLGFPNTGKSTLISVISAAKPKIADYPFTTLVPNLGVVKLDDGASFVVADIPGLIEGASQGSGLGVQFLKHIERTRMFLHLVDPMSERDPLEDYRKIRHELAQYDELYQPETPLSEREELVAISKIDSVSAEEVDELKLKFMNEHDVRVMTISSVTSQGVSDVVERLAKKVFPDE